MSEKTKKKAELQAAVGMYYVARKGKIVRTKVTIVGDQAFVEFSPSNIRVMKKSEVFPDKASLLKATGKTKTAWLAMNDSVTKVFTRVSLQTGESTVHYSDGRPVYREYSTFNLKSKAFESLARSTRADIECTQNSLRGMKKRLAAQLADVKRERAREAKAKKR